MSFPPKKQLTRIRHLWREKQPLPKRRFSTCLICVSLVDQGLPSLKKLECWQSAFRYPKPQLLPHGKIKL